VQRPGQTLTPTTPVTLTYDNGEGLVFTRVISVDEHFAFHFEDTIANTPTQTASVAGYGRVTRFFRPKTQGIYVLHEGLIGVIGEEGLQEIDYSDVEDTPIMVSQGHCRLDGNHRQVLGGSACAAAGRRLRHTFAHFTDGRARYQADFKSDAMAIAAGWQRHLDDAGVCRRQGSPDHRWLRKTSSIS
jgi:YidC/Oxa1 family membrane protein insertase